MEFKPFKIGKYLLLERLAMGGMAEVYRAKASGAGGFEKQLAIKRILPNYSENEEFRRMFEYEARLSSQLTHANIVQVYDFVKSGETYLLAMEYVDGKNLRQFLNKLKKIGVTLPIEYGAYLINEVSKGLEYAHQKRDDLTNRPLNIIHRDMSPQNVMLSYEGSVKIVDFGIAKAKGRVDETRSGVIKGKFGYMSPEQANGEQTDHRTDIFSTTIILYELLTGRRLFTADNDMATLKMIQECVITPPSKFNPKITVDLEKIVMKGLTKDMSLRYQTAGQLNKALQEYISKTFPSFTQKELSELIQRVFREEIETEKKRFEQIYRQSIPFSQGQAESPSDEEQSNAPEYEVDDDASLTASEDEGKTGVTQLEAEAPFESDLPEPDRSRSIAHEKSYNTNTNAQDKGSFEDSLNVSSEVTHVSQISDIEPDPESKQSEGMSWAKDSRTMDEESAAKGITSDKTIVQEDSMTDIPSALSNQATPTQERSKTPQRPNPKPASVSRRPEPKKQEKKEPEKDSRISSSGMSLEDSPDAAGRRERSISLLRNIRKGESPANETEISVSQTGNFSLNSYPSGKKQQNPLSGIDVQEEPQAGGRYRAAREEYFEVDDREPRSSLGLFKTLASIVLLGGLVYGTWSLYNVYRKGSFVQTYINNIKPDRDVTKSPGDLEAEPGREPQGGTKAIVNQCSLKVDSDPRGASIEVDNTKRGTTPTALLFECGVSINLTVRKDGYETFRENHVVQKDGQAIYRTMKKIPLGQLELRINPGATVKIPDVGFAQYVNSGDVLTVSIPANRKVKVLFRNEVFDISLEKTFIVEEGSVVREELNIANDRQVGSDQ